MNAEAGAPGPEGCAIRPCSADDAPAMHEAVRESLAELIPWMPWCHPEYSVRDARAWLRTQVQAFNERKWFEFTIVGPDGRYLGQCGLNQFDELNRRCNLGYWVRTSATRRGVATRAVGLLRGWAFENTALVRLEIVIASANQGSLRVAEKSGALREGVHRHRLFLRGTPLNAVMFSFIR
jgi:RimJ/RimL family protein N-acetyltransferase